jgi:hypothetical protein
MKKMRTQQILKGQTSQTILAREWYHWKAYGKYIPLYRIYNFYSLSFILK